MKTILVPLDGSALSEQALPYATALAKALQAQIDLVRIVPDIERENLLVDSLSTMYVGEVAGTYTEQNQRVLDMLRDQADGYLSARAEPLRLSGFDVTQTVRVGPPAEVLVELANHVPEPLIVMATHGYSGLQRWALGSVADKIVHATQAPIVLVRKALPEGVEPNFSEIVVPLDGSPIGNQVLSVATELAGKVGAELVLLHAIDPLAEAYPSVRTFGAAMTRPDQMLNEVVKDADAYLQKTAEDLAGGKVRIATMTLIGYPAEVIVDESERRQAGLIMMATHGYSGLRRWALGSVADKVLHNTTTPLLLVRAKSA